MLIPRPSETDNPILTEAEIQQFRQAVSVGRRGFDCESTKFAAQTCYRMREICERMQQRLDRVIEEAKPQ
jgi:hypothetical protein